MSGISRYEISAENARCGFVRAGDFLFLSFRVGNVVESVERQIDGALDNMSERLPAVNLTLDSIVKDDVILRDVWDIPVMEEVSSASIPVEIERAVELTS